jgi:hypothetical protein
MANVGPPRSSGSQLPWLVGGGCAGLLLLSLALVALAMCVVGTIMLRRNNQAPQSVQLKTPAVQPVGTPGLPDQAPQPVQLKTPVVQPVGTPGLPGDVPGSEPSNGVGSGESGGPLSEAAGSGFTLIQTGGYTCDINVNQCRPLISGTGETIEVRTSGGGTIELQQGTMTLVVNADCSLVNQPAYTLFPCPFFPGVQQFQGVMITAQGTQPIYSPFQYALIDIDYDQDGVVNEPGYFSLGAGSTAFEAYREDGKLKFIGYTVDTGNYTYLYVITFQAR